MPPLMLETFSDVDVSSEADEAQTSIADEARLSGFDAGYAAGWDDAAAAHAQDKSLAEAKTSEALQSLGFTYQEARTHVLSSLEPLLTEMALKLLPRLAQAALPALIVETILPMAEKLADPPVTIWLHPDSRAAVEKFCVPALGLPVTIVDDPSLTAGDIRLTLDGSEARINLDSAVSTIILAISDFFTLQPKAQRHAG